MNSKPALELLALHRERIERELAIDLFGTKAEALEAAGLRE
jgi:hypothetical protein